MDIRADKEGINAILTVIHKGMKGGAFGGDDAVALAVLQQSIKPIEEDEPKGNDDKEEKTNVKD